MLYVPYHTVMRGGPDGMDPVGSLQVNAEATGDAGGGVVNIILSMLRQPFGFPILWAPTMVSATDNLASAEDVALSFSSGRLITDMQQTITMVATANAGDLGNAKELGVSLEGRDAVVTVATATWSTNTDTKSYHLHMFGPVYDLQLIALKGRISDIMAGLR